MQQNGSLYYIASDNFSECKRAIAFDLDWTLTFGLKHLIPRLPDDIYLLPGRAEKLNMLTEKGWGFVIFTNQKVKGSLQERLQRMENGFNLIPGSKAMFIATKDDDFRKPNVGMFEAFRELYPNCKVYTYVGDAAGRPQDFSDSDLSFAKNAKLKFLTPESVFKTPMPSIPIEGKHIVLLMGMPGSGKSKFYTDFLEPKGYVHINQDTLKTFIKVLGATEQALEEGKLVCVDNTNPKVETRNEYYTLAKTYGYTVHVWYLVRDGHGWNKLREHPVPDIAYHTYFKKLEITDDVEFI